MSKLNAFLTYTDYELTSFYSEAGLAALLQHVNVVRNETGRVLEGRELAEAARGCQIILAHRSSPGLAETFEHAPDLVAFLRAAVDISTVDVKSATGQGILVTRATAGFGRAVAEMGIAMIFDLARGISLARSAYAKGEEPILPKGLQVVGSILGVVGYGVIGKSLAELGSKIGMKVLVSDPNVDQSQVIGTKVEFGELLVESDFVVCLAVAIPATENLFNADAFAQMKQGASFINLSRGQLVDEGALMECLNSGRLRGAGLDVGRGRDQKPSTIFVGRPDVIVMPHVAGMTAQARERQTMDTVAQVAALANGQVPANPVNLEGATRLSRLGINISGAKSEARS